MSVINFYKSISLLVFFSVFAVSPVMAAGPGVKSTYHIGPQDVLEISVWKEEGLQKEVLVRPDGGFSFPLIGDIMASGKTVSQMIVEITQRLSKYINGPVVNVAVLKVGGKSIYVTGNVKKPGEYVVRRYVDVMQALSMAGGMTPFAEAAEIKILRRTVSELIAIPFDYTDVSIGKRLEQSIVLENGDIIVVP